MTKRKRRQREIAASRKARPQAGWVDSGGREGELPGSAPADGLRRWLLGALVALFVVRPLFPSESAAFEGDGLPLVMLWIALATFWMLGAIGWAEFRVRFGCFDAAVLALAVLHTIAGVAAAAHLSPRPAVNVLWEWIGLGLAYFLARQFIVTRREARAAVVAMIALAASLSSYGLYQYCYEMPRTRAEYAADPDAAMRAAGMSFPPGSPQRKLFEDRLASTEPIATFALTNSLAGYLVPWLVVAAGIVAGSSSGRVRVVLCMIPVAACLLLTKSRSGYAAAVFGFLLVGMLCRRQKLRIGWKLPAVVATIATILVAAAILAGGLDREVLSEASKSLGYRVQYWQSTMRMIGDKPLLGCGPGNFQFAYTRYKLPEASEEVADPHNFLLEVWATAGTPAMLAMLAALACFAWKVYPRSNGLHGNVPEAESDVAIPNGDLHVYGGAVCGFLAAIPLGQMSAGPPGLASVFIGLPAAVACIALLHGWVDNGRLPGVLPAIGLSALLVNLLAAGGIGFPGVAGSLWLLAALGLNESSDVAPRSLPRGVALGGLIVAITLAVTCYQSAYGPVLRCQGFLRLAESNPADARQHLAAAAESDPLSARPWRQLTAITFGAWRQDASAEKFRRFETCNATVLQLEPNSSTAWASSADWYAKAFAETGQKEHIDRAVQHYRRAVQLYPNNGMHWAKLALAHRAAGNEAAFRDAADGALRLDKLTPHKEKKLPSGLRRELSRGSIGYRANDEAI